MDYALMFGIAIAALIGYLGGYMNGWRAYHDYQKYEAKIMKEKQ